MAEQNAWQLHKLNNGKLDHLAFRRRIVGALLETNKKSMKKGPCKQSSRSIQDTIGLTIWSFHRIARQSVVSVIRNVSPGVINVMLVYTSSAS